MYKKRCKITCEGIFNVWIDVFQSMTKSACCNLVLCSKRKRFSGPVQLLQISVFKILKNASGTEKNQIQKRNVYPRVMYFGIYLQKLLKASKAEVFPRDDAFSKSEHALSGSPSFENAYALS